MNSSKIVIATSLNGHARVYIADTSFLVEQARLTHNLWPSSCSALGRSLSITSVMGSMLKSDEESITTIINGNGPIGSIICTVKGNGNIKGFCGNNAIYLKKNLDNKLIVGDIVGKDGYLKVIKDLRLKNKYSSQVKLQTGEISEDFSYYFRKSEQTPCIISSGVEYGLDYKVNGAGCVFIELMPGYVEDDVKYLENIISIIKDNPISIYNAKQLDLVGYIKLLFNDSIVLDIKNIQFSCDCSKEKFYDNLKALPASDLYDLLKDDNVEIKCEFCNKKYFYKKVEIENLIK